MMILADHNNPLPRRTTDRKLQLLNVDEESLRRCCGAPFEEQGVHNARHCEIMFLCFAASVAMVLSLALALVSSAASTPSSDHHDHRKQHHQTDNGRATDYRR